MSHNRSYLAPADDSDSDSEQDTRIPVGSTTPAAKGDVSSRSAQRNGSGRILPLSSSMVVPPSPVVRDVWNTERPHALKKHRGSAEDGLRSAGRLAATSKRAHADRIRNLKKMKLPLFPQQTVLSRTGSRGTAQVVMAPRMFAAAAFHCERTIDAVDKSRSSKDADKLSLMDDISSSESDFPSWVSEYSQYTSLDGTRSRSWSSHDAPCLFAERMASSADESGAWNIIHRLHGSLSTGNWKQDLHGWLQHVGVVHDTLFDVSDDPPARIFAFVCANDYEKAVQVAAKAGYPRLAVLLSSGGTGSSTTTMKTQLAMWKSSRQLHSMNQFVAAVYFLLAHDIEGALKMVEGSLTVPWIAVLSLVLNFDESRVFSTFSECVARCQEICQVCSQSCSPWPSSTAPDIRLTLLDNVAVQQSSSMKSLVNMYDPELVWLLVETMSGIGVSKDVELRDFVSSAFATALFATGKWHLALYALRSHSDTAYTEAKIVETLEEFVRENTDGRIRTFVQRDVGVPSEAWSRALALRALKDGRVDDAAQHFCDAAEWTKAHDLFVAGLVPQLVLDVAAGEADAGHLLQNFLANLKAHSDRIPQWSSAGALVLHCIEVIQQIKVTQGPHDDLAEQASIAAKRLLFDFKNETGEWSEFVDSAKSMWRQELASVLLRLRQKVSRCYSNVPVCLGRPADRLSHLVLASFHAATTNNYA